MKKLEIEKTKPTFIISVLKVDYYRVCKFKSIHLETAFVYFSYVPQEYEVVSICCVEQDDNSK